MRPKVSVVIPVYNVEDFLAECLNSVVNQTLKDIEIICVDDGSKDHSGAILDDYAAHDKRIKVIHKENGGYGKAMNVGIDAATGDYIGIVEPDDYIAPTMYEILYNKALEYDLDLIKSDFCRFWNENGQIKCCDQILDRTGKYYGLLVDLSEDIKPYKFPMNTWTGIYKRSYLNQYHIRHHETPGASYQDNGFWWQTFWHAKRAMFLPYVFYHKRKDNPNSSVNNPAKVFCIKEEYDWIRNLLDQTPELRSKFLGIYYLYKFYNYRWTFFRINQKFRKMWLKVFHQEFKQALRLQEIDLSLFNAEETKELNLIVSNPIKFYRTSLNRPSIIEKIFSVRNRGGMREIRVLGLTIKFRTSKLAYQELKQEIDRQRQDFNRALNIANERYQRLMYKIAEYCPDEKLAIALKDWFYETTGDVLDLAAPQTFNEKIQWLKLYDSTSLKTRLSDKYFVRQYVKEKIGDEYLVPLLGIWNKFEEIDFNKLPDEFVLKCSHGRGYSIVVPNKAELDKRYAQRRITQWMQENYAFKHGFEIQYASASRKIFAEKYIPGLAKSQGNIYSFFCINGEVHQIWRAAAGNTPNHGTYIYDGSGKELSVSGRFPEQNESKDVADSQKLKAMAEKLAQGFCFIRIDFYYFDEKIYFRNLAFTPMFGDEFKQSEVISELSGAIKLPEHKMSTAEID